MKIILDGLWAGTAQSYEKVSKSLEKIEAKDFNHTEISGLLQGLRKYGHFTPGEYSAEDIVTRASGYIIEDEDEDETDPNEEHWLLEGVEGYDDIILIRVDGPMVNGRAGFWGWYFGYIGYGDIQDAIMCALELGYKKFIFDWATPGGSVAGIEEASAFIRELTDSYPVYSFTSNSVLSAGVWMAVHTDKFYATRMSQIGSIGVLAILKEYSKYLEDQGITSTVIRSGKFKGIGNPYEPLSAESKAKFEEDVMIAHNFFVQTVADNRGLTFDFVNKEIADGSWWYSEQAKALGLIDEIKTFSEVVLALSEETDNNTVVYDTSSLNSGVYDMKKRKLSLTAQGQAALASGVPLEEVLKAEGTTDNAEDDTSDENTQEEQAGDQEQETGTKEDDQNTGEKSEASVKPLDMVAKLTDDLVEAKVALNTERAKLQALETAASGMKAVVVQAIQHAIVAVGGVAPDTEALQALEPSVLLLQHSQAKAAFDKRFSVAGRVTVDVDDADSENNAANNAASYEQSVYQDLARFKHK